MMDCKKLESKEEETSRHVVVETDDYLKNSNELVELTKTRLMRAFVEAQDPSSKVVDDLMLRRFLRARDLDVEQASAMFLKYLKWRQAFAPNGSISASEVPNQIAQNKMFLQGSDKRGCPIAVLLGARHFQVKGGLKEFKRYVVYAFDKICARMPPGQEKFIFIGDLEGWGYSNSDIRAYLGAVSILQDYYPERLGKMFVVHVPFLFTTVWKIICPFIDNKTKEKIVFVENKMLKSTLLEEIDESQLPEKYGGKLTLVPI
ncbi:phosphatidylinositol transfer protein 3 isoform X2 [Rosa chinensis]|uniref:phosphatidylinositol transfer protein 3 isoform X2 n=1 Tax=Rosa chinensis TaxID=74649 RepID=UPI000D093AEC|nr:phosphatidylinositol transfer protein 3 isoform X2 [Rosa chinensis]